MSSTVRFHEPNPRRPTAPAIAGMVNDGLLPLDLLYQILLRLPMEPLCRFRAVCRSWRSLLCHPDFIAAAHNPGHLLIAMGLSRNYPSIYEAVNILDMESDDAITPFSYNLRPYGETPAMISNDHVAYVVISLHNRLYLLDLSNGVASLLPDPTLPQDYECYSFTVGSVTSTGEHKVFSIYTSDCRQEPQICKILTLGGDDDGWRDTGNPPLKATSGGGDVPIMDGVAYFEPSREWDLESKDLNTELIMAFDLDSETWRSPASQGPANRPGACLVELNGHLVASYANQQFVELWFLVDSELSLWSMRYTITMPCHQNPSHTEWLLKPLVVLDDGRIVLWMRVYFPRAHNAVIRIYDPKTKTFGPPKRVPNCSNISVFAWSLLHSGPTCELDRIAKCMLVSRRHVSRGHVFNNGSLPHYDSVMVRSHDSPPTWRWLASYSMKFFGHRAGHHAGTLLLDRVSRLSYLYDAVGSLVTCRHLRAGEKIMLGKEIVIDDCAISVGVQIFPTRISSPPSGSRFQCLVEEDERYVVGGVAKQVPRVAIDDDEEEVGEGSWTMVSRKKKSKEGLVQ